MGLQDIDFKTKKGKVEKARIKEAERQLEKIGCTVLGVREWPGDPRYWEVVWREPSMDTDTDTGKQGVGGE